VWRRVGPAALLAAAWLVVSGPAAGAHAVLRASDPAGGASVATAPDAVTLRFSEAPDPSLSVVRVLDAAGRVVSRGVASPTGNPLELRVSLAAQESGTYTVAWRAVSRVDGHVSRGAFAFGVGPAGGPDADPRGVVPAPVPSPTGAGRTGPSPLAVAARWCFFSGMALLLGGAATGALVFGRRLPARAVPMLSAALALGAGGLLAMTAATARDAGVPLTGLLGSGTGHWIEARAAALLLAAVAVVPLALAARRRPGDQPGATQVPAWRPCRAGWLLLLGCAASAGLLLHALAGHAAAPSPLRWLNLLSQWAHLLAVAVWIGGLAWLLAGIASAPRHAVVMAARRFSVLATWSLAAVALTGLQRAAAEVGGWSGLLGTAFGRALDVKLGLFAALVLLGGVNHFQVVPSVGVTRPSRLRRTGGSELVLAGAVLLAAAVLSQLPPGAEAAATGPVAPRPPSSVEASGTDYSTTVRVTIQVSPGVAGPNRFVATVADYDTGAQLAVGEVRLTASLPARPEVAPAPLDLARSADGRWRGQGSLLTIAGTWSLTALIERAGGGITVTMDLRVGAAAS
jgi:copper transport protein